MSADEGYELVSLDIDPKYNPFMVVDVLEWEFRAANPVGHFDVVFVCPPCDKMSRARTTKPRDMVSAYRLVDRTMDFVRHLRPARWFIKNPQRGLMKALSCMAYIPYLEKKYFPFSTRSYQMPKRF
jgi:hypothetical protein